jgi:outer membrane protein assembly factor BamB
MHHPVHKAAKSSMLLLSIVLSLYSLSSCGTNPGSSTLHINDKVRATGTPVSGKPQASFVPPGGHYESLAVGNRVTYFGSDNGNLYALQANNGNLLWHYDAGNPVYVVALVNGSVYATSGANDDVMYALDANIGTVLWHRQIDSQIFGSVIVNGVVYLNTNNSGSDAQGGSVYALRASDGSILWHQFTHLGMPAPLTVLDGIVYTRAADTRRPHLPNYIYALRASDGHFLWKYGISEFPGQPAEVNGVVYVVASAGTVYALRAGTGILLWRFTGFSGVLAAEPPVVVNAVVYVGTDVGIIYALQAADGTLLWHHDLPASFDNTLSLYGPPVIVSDVLYVAVNSGTVYALKAHDGSLLWSHTNGRSAFGPLILTDGTVQVSTQGNNIYALRVSDGALLWQHSIGSFQTWEVQSPPCVLGNKILYVGTEDGVVTALRTSDGAQLWHFSIKEQAELAEPVLNAYVHFGSSVTYAYALRSVTDLGLQIFTPCARKNTAWRPVGAADSFNSYPFLWVQSTPLAPTGWLDRLKAIQGVQSVQESSIFFCPHLVPAPPGTTTFLQKEQVGAYVHLTFGGSVKSYVSALAAVSNLGFRLGNPCYEQAKGAKPAWSPMGQEAMFTNTHTLILVTTNSNSTHWPDQLRAVTGVTQVATTFDVKC